MKNKAYRITLYVASVAILLFLLCPIAWMFISSLQLQSELFSVPPHWIPHNPTLWNYLVLLYPSAIPQEELVNILRVPFLSAILNSSVYSVGVTLACLLLGAPSAYVLARTRFKGSRFLSLMILSVRMIPVITIIVPLYVLAIQMKLANTLHGLIIIQAGLLLPYTIWILRGYFLVLPRELEEAAKVDGCSKIGSFLRIILPLSLPGFTSTAVIIFLLTWNSFLEPLIIAPHERVITLGPAMARMAVEMGVDFGVLNAAGCIAALPTIILALVLQKYVLRGLISGALK